MAKKKKKPAAAPQPKVNLALKQAYEAAGKKERNVKQLNKKFAKQSRTSVVDMVRELFFWIGVVGLLAVAVLLGQIYVSYPNTYSDTQIPSGCRVVEGVRGPEDFALDVSTDTVLISSADHRQLIKLTHGEFPGGIFAFSLKNQTLNSVPILSYPHSKFYPHGIDLFTTKRGERLLFVVNHLDEGDHVSIFSYDGRALTHKESIRHKDFISLNDVAAVGERSFYVTNDHGLPRGMSTVVESLLALPWSNILFYNGNTAQTRVIKSGLVFANGIEVDRLDGRFLYATSSQSGKLYVFERALDDSMATEINEVELHSNVDNVLQDVASGDLYVGAHPSAFKFMGLLYRVLSHSPSQVFRVKRRSGNKFEVTQVYSSQGNEPAGAISAGSAGLYHKGKLLVGSALDDHIVYCPSLSS